MATPAFGVGTDGFHPRIGVFGGYDTVLRPGYAVPLSGDGALFAVVMLPGVPTPERAIYPFGAVNINQRLLRYAIHSVSWSTPWSQGGRLTVPLNNVFNLVSIRVEGSQVFLRINGAVDAPSSSGAVGAASIERVGFGSSIGYGNSQWAALELRVYSGRITEAEEAAISNDLRSLYSLP